MPQKEKLNNLIHRINKIESIYVNDILHSISDSLEIISGFPKNRLYLSFISPYCSNEDFLDPIHIRGYKPYPLKEISLNLKKVKKYNISFRMSLRNTYEANAHNSMKHIISLDYSESNMEGSAIIGKLLNIKSSLIFPLIFNGKCLGVGTIDSSEPIAWEDFHSCLKPIYGFLKKIGAKLAETKEVLARIYQEKSLNKLVSSMRITSLLNELIQERIADLSVLLIPQRVLNKIDSMPLIPFSIASKLKSDRVVFEETLMNFQGAMDLRSNDFILTTVIMNRDNDKYMLKTGTSNIPNLISFKDMSCSFEDELKKKAGFTAGIFYPIVDRHKDILYIIILYLKNDTLKKVRSLITRGKGKHYLNNRLSTIESKVNSVIYDLPDSSIVADELIGIYQINQNYEKYNRIKDIRNGLSGFLHRILRNVMVITGADCGIIGIVENIDDKKYVVVEREGGLIIGAKIGDIHDTYVKPFQIGTEEDLLTQERSLSGLAAAHKKTMLITGFEKSDEINILRRPFPGMKSVMATPVIIGNKAVAVICIGARNKYSFLKRSQLILEMISQLVKENIHKLIKKYIVSEEVLRLYGGRYPYIKNDALNYLAELYHNYFLNLNRFLDETFENYKTRRRDRKDKENYIILKDVKKAYLDSKLQQINLKEYMEKTDNDIANYIYLKLKYRKVSFFDAVQAEYIRHNISRQVAILVFEKAKYAVEKPLITRIAVHLNVCDSNYKGNYENKKKIERFREFYKKTIGIKL
ncbi:MAG TPA: GAF domain-containing protein [Euryarchaeota archaeon]|nr:GAF domain-containing protein [Euryarchaeota archaeon]